MSYRLAFIIPVIATIVVSCVPSTEQSPTSGPVLSVWMPELDAVTDSVVAILIKSFEKHRACSVSLHYYTYKSAHSLIDSLRPPSRPDIVVADLAVIAALAEAQLLAPVSKPDSVERLFHEGALHSLRWKRSLMALPWLVDTRVVYVNPDIDPVLKSAAPSTQEALLDLCEQLGTQRAIGWAAHGEDHGRMIYSILPFFWSFGGDIVVTDSLLVVDTPENERALAHCVEMSRTGKLETERQLDAEFNHGTLGIWFGNSRLMAYCLDNQHARNARAFLFPGSEKHSGVSVISGLAAGVVAKSENQLLAKMFIDNLTVDSSLRQLTSSVKSPLPARLTALNELRSSSINMRAVACEQLLQARSVPCHPKWQQISRLIELMTLSVMYGEVQPAEALKRLRIQIQELVTS